MGVTASQDAFASHKGLLARLASAENIEYNDAFWRHVLAFPASLPSLEPVAVEAALIPHCRQLCKSMVICSIEIAVSRHRLREGVCCCCSGAQPNVPQLPETPAAHSGAVECGTIRQRRADCRKLAQPPYLHAEIHCGNCIYQHVAEPILGKHTVARTCTR